MAEIGVELSVQKNRPIERLENTLIVTTSHSYKGHESEVLIIPCVDQYVTGDGQILASNLYVAMTRAKDHLFLTYVMYRHFRGQPQWMYKSRFIDEMFQK